MHHFRIVPKGTAGMSVEISASDGSAALNVMSRTTFDEADVWQDGHYVFSVRKEGHAATFWTIFQKSELATPMPLFN